MSLTVIRPFRLNCCVHHQKFLDAMLLQQALGLFERGADRNGDQIVLGHHGADGLIEGFLKAQVAVGEDADEFACRA